MTHSEQRGWAPRIDLSASVGGPTVWIGAVSFEDRCVASLERLREMNVPLGAVVPLEYSTSVWPKAENDELRNRNRSHMVRLYGDVGNESGVNRHIDSYSFQEIQDTLAGVLDNWRPARTVVDISCLTKIHLLAVASMLERYRHATQWILAYSVPENYGDIGGSSKDFGWRDVIVAPLGNRGRLENEARGRGIVVVGHEADRVVVALAELEPSGGVIIVADNSRRPDLRYCSMRNHRKVIRQLVGMNTSDWTTCTVKLEDVAAIQRAVSREIDLAEEYGAPVILFPYGPKPVVFALAHLLSQRCEDLAWFVYPLPSGYRVDHSEGVDETLWFEPFGRSVLTSPMKGFAG